MEFTIVGDKENQQIDTVEKWKRLIFRLFVLKKKEIKLFSLLIKLLKSVYFLS